MFDIRFSENAERHLKAFPARDRRVIMDAIEEHLTHQPTGRTRNRKQLRENPLAAWELRVREFRVLYNVDEESFTVLLVRQITNNVAHKPAAQAREFAKSLACAAGLCARELRIWHTSCRRREGGQQFIIEGEEYPL